MLFSESAELDEPESAELDESESAELDEPDSLEPDVADPDGAAFSSPPQPVKQKHEAANKKAIDARVKVFIKIP